MKLVDIAGNRYGRLVVLPKDERERGKWKCVCDCGNIVLAGGSDLTRGFIKSCGCLKKEVAAENGKTQKKHGLRNTRLYREWTSMKNRCFNPKAPGYGDYGGRGITVCEGWKNDFMAFYTWAVANGYDETARRGVCTIERKDNDGHYSPENCVWASNTEQQNNKRNNRLIEYNGVIKTVPQWANEIGINKSTIHSRLNNGWSAERTLTEPIHKEKQRR